MKESMLHVVGASRYTLKGAWGFAFTGQATAGPPKGIHGQDYIHAAKKLMNSCDVPSRRLMLGAHLVTLAHAVQVRQHFSLDMHGTYARDAIRSDRQNWETVQRLCKKAHLDCLGEMHEKRLEFSKGTQMYLSVIRRYIHIFYSKKMQLAARAKEASYIIHFLARWRFFVLKHKDLDVGTNYITDEAHADCLLSCHQVILTIMAARDCCPSTPLHL